jgi:hypothetical protein
MKRTSGLSLKTSRCAWSGNNAAIHTVAIEMKATHDVDPQPRPSAVTTSM